MNIETITVRYIDDHGAPTQRDFYTSSNQSPPDAFLAWLVDGGVYSRIDALKSYILTERVMDRLKGRT